jgi:hypothetical protein
VSKIFISNSKLCGATLRIPLFFLARLAVIPDLADQYWNSDWSALGAVETWAARVMLPIPVALNVYWMGLIMQGAMKFLSTGSDEGGKPADKKKN